MRTFYEAPNFFFFASGRSFWLIWPKSVARSWQHWTYSLYSKNLFFYTVKDAYFSAFTLISKARRISCVISVKKCNQTKKTFYFLSCTNSQGGISGMHFSQNISLALTLKSSLLDVPKIQLRALTLILTAMEFKEPHFEKRK
jgi:hypothetical protein